MTDYYLGLGYGQTYSNGEFDFAPTLPVTDTNLISHMEIVMSDDPMDYEVIRDEKLAALEDGDTLVVVYPNKATLYILDEWQEDFHIPHNQREELWTSEGIEETYIYFINEEEENWIWLADAQVDYYDEDDRPVPLYPSDEE